MPSGIRGIRGIRGTSSLRGRGRQRLRHAFSRYAACSPWARWTPVTGIWPPGAGVEGPRAGLPDLGSLPLRLHHSFRGLRLGLGLALGSERALSPPARGPRVDPPALPRRRNPASNAGWTWVVNRRSSSAAEVQSIPRDEGRKSSWFWLSRTRSTGMQRAWAEARRREGGGPRPSGPPVRRARLALEYEARHPRAVPARGAPRPGSQSTCSTPVVSQVATSRACT